MRIFVVSTTGSGTDPQVLINQLSRIQHAQGKTVPVIIVDDRYNLGTLPNFSQPTDFMQFRLESFLYTEISGLVKPDAIAQHMDNTDSHWILIEAGHHDQSTYFDFIRKLARYNYLSPALRHRSLVFTSPSIFLGSAARFINESFNNLPPNSAEQDQKKKIRALFLRAHLGRALIDLPRLSAVLSRCHRLFSNVYRRLRGPV